MSGKSVVITGTGLLGAAASVLVGLLSLSVLVDFFDGMVKMIFG